MNQGILLAAAALVAGGTSLLTSQLLQQPAAAAAPADSAAFASMQNEIETLQRDLAALRSNADTRVAETSANGTMRIAANEPDAALIEAAVERALEKRGMARTKSDDAAVPAATDAKSALASLRGKSDFWSNAEFYKRIHADGRMGELIAAFEAAAEAAPNDTGAQMDLGNAYLAYLQLDNSKWALSQKADQSFDRVLAIDDTHWNARFTKAMSYTFWPDFLGKKKEAIAHFETLMTQQDSRPAEAHESNTYLILGNLLEQRGETEKAKEVWRRGLRRHPGDAQLTAKVGG